MTTPTWLYWVYLGMHAFLLVPVTGYAYRFHRKSEGHWWKSLTGQSLMLLAISLALNILPAMVGTVWILATGHAMPGRVAIGAVAYMVAGVALWLLWFAFERVQRSSRVDTDN